MNSLTQSEKDDLSLLKNKISAGARAWLELASAAVEIRDRKLYREESDTFESFCESNWGWTRGRINQLIRGAEVVKSLSPGLDTVVSNEAQARALGSVPPEQRSEVVEKVVSSGAPVTAKAIESARKEVTKPVAPPKPKDPIIELDKVGYPIPEKLIPNWRRAESEAKDAMAMISKIRCALKDAEEANDIIYREMRFQENVGHLSNLYSNFKLVVPHAVCTTCQGRAPEKCTFCKGRGFISEFAYKTFVPEELKKMREKTSKKK